jgi:hypothetical protein
MFKYPKTIIAITLFIALVAYGFYEKDRRQQLYKDYYVNKPILCDDVIIKLEDKWIIHNNRFFTNGKVFKTIVHCESME